MTEHTDRSFAEWNDGVPAWSVLWPLIEVEDTTLEMGDGTEVDASVGDLARVRSAVVTAWNVAALVHEKGFPASALRYIRYDGEILVLCWSSDEWQDALESSFICGWISVGGNCWDVTGYVVTDEETRLAAEQTADGEVGAQ